MFLHQRIEVLIGLLQRASIVWSAKQAANAVGVEAPTQPFGKRLRQAFQDLADAKPLREQPANSVHRAVAATIHADLRSRKGAPHRLGLIDMNVAIGLVPSGRPSISAAKPRRWTPSSVSSPAR